MHFPVRYLDSYHFKLHFPNFYLESNLPPRTSTISIIAEKYIYTHLYVYEYICTHTHICIYDRKRFISTQSYLEDLQQTFAKFKIRHIFPTISTWSGIRDLLLPSKSQKISAVTCILSSFPPSIPQSVEKGKKKTQVFLL